MNRPTKWKLRVQSLMACNCNWGCPCSFESPPTYGMCETALAYRVVEGIYGGISLDSLKWVLAATWPGPLYERGGRGMVFLDSRANPAQREALQAIATGKAGGPIGIFMSTITNGLNVRTGRIEFKYDDKHSRFSVEEAIHVAFEAIRNPVTNEEHVASILLPTGMLTKREDAFSAREFSVEVGQFNFSYPGRNALAFTNTWRGP